MKKIQIIQNLFDKASIKADTSEEGIGVAILNRNGRLVYAVEINHRDNIARLYHYGTRTIDYDIRQGIILGWYGESVSDRDSMNTFLDCLGDEENYFRYGPVMGFVHEFRDSAYS